MKPQVESPIRNERGQSMVEASISMVLIVLLLLGTVEFGRAFMISNSVTNAARVGARAAAIEPISNRTESGAVADTSLIVAAVRDEIAAVVGNNVANALSIQVSHSNGGLPVTSVTVSGTVPYMFNLAGPSFQLNRTVSYRDQML